jgi:hypothetical protein
MFFIAKLLIPAANHLGGILHEYGDGRGQQDN